MKRIALERAFLLGLAVDASNEAVGAWARLLSYAGSDDVESSRLAGAKDWNGRQWDRRCQLSARDVSKVVAAKLARWDGDDLIIEGFDQAGLDALNAKRAAGSFGSQGGRGHKKGSPKPEGNEPGNPEGSGPGNPQLGIGEEGISGDQRSGDQRSGDQKKGERNGGGGDASRSAAAVRALAAFREARARVLKAGWQATSVESSRDIDEFCDRVDRLSESQQALLHHVADQFFGREGKEPGDSFWVDRGWSLHVFASQGIDYVLPDVEADYRRQQEEYEADLMARYPKAWGLYGTDRQRWTEHLECAFVGQRKPEGWEARFAAVEQRLRGAAA